MNTATDNNRELPLQSVVTEFPQPLFNAAPNGITKSELKRKELDKKMKFSPSLKEEGCFTQISNHIILHPELTAEEKELILVYLMNKNGFELTIDGYCDDLRIKPRQVIKTLNSLIDKGIFEIEGKYCKLRNVKIDNAKHNLKSEKGVLKDNSSLGTDVLQDTKSCVAAQVLTKKDAFNDTEKCVPPQVIPELSLEHQGVWNEDKTTNKTGSDERTFKMGARPSDKTMEDSVNANFEISSSEGRTPLDGAPSESLTGNPNDFFYNLESSLTSTETMLRRPDEVVHFISEYWTDENTTNTNYRRFKRIKDKVPGFKYTFRQFEDLLTMALYIFLLRVGRSTPINNSQLQRFSVCIGLENNDQTHISYSDLNDAILFYESKDPDSKSAKTELFARLKIKLPKVQNNPKQGKPNANQVPANSAPAIPALTGLERVRQITQGLRGKL